MKPFSTVAIRAFSRWWKDPQRQVSVVDAVLEQRLAGESALNAIMIESHLVDGRQSLDSDPLIYGQSVTDACLAFDETRRAIEDLANRLAQTA